MAQRCVKTGAWDGGWRRKPTKVALSTFSVTTENDQPVCLSCKFQALRTPNHHPDNETDTKSVAGGFHSPGDWGTRNAAGSLPLTLLSTASESSLKWPHLAVTVRHSAQRGLSPALQCKHSGLKLVLFKLINPHTLVLKVATPPSKRWEKRAPVTSVACAVYCPSRPRRGGSWGQRCWREKLNLLSS